MSKIIKKILIFQKRKNGSISILVLIMGLAVILLTTAMVGYIFHDIGFTELDKDKLRALHFAESGLSNMYYKIEQYSNSGVPLPLESPESYTVEVPDPADPEGSFEVEYEIITKEGMPGEVYAITSTGVDISSGAERKVRVETIYINIYDFIFSGRASGAAQLAGQINITGPFFVADIIDDELLGNTSFNKGPLFVKGDINISGNASIGEPEGVGYGPIILVQGGLFNGELFDPENPPDNVYVSEYYHKAIDVTLTAIDNDYIELVIASGALVIGSPSENKDLFIGDEEIEVDGVAIVGGYEGLKFNNGILEISGEIVVYGDIEIGKKNDTIEYSGNANLISTGNITIEAQVIPEENLAYFPSTDLMALISQNNIDLHAKGGTYENPDAAVMLIANNKVETQSTNTFLRGGTVSNILILKQNTTIHYETGIGGALSTGAPGFDSIIFNLNWQEIID